MMSYEESDEYSGVNEGHAAVKYTNALCHLHLFTLYNSQFIPLLYTLRPLPWHAEFSK